MVNKFSSGYATAVRVLIFIGILLIYHRKIRVEFLMFNMKNSP